MGEHKIDRHMISEQMATELAKAAAEKGCLIEVGWIAMLRYVVPKDAGETQVAEMRKSFFMGAEHLYASIVNIMDADSKVTKADLGRVALIDDELKAFRKAVTSHHAAPGRTQ